MIVLFFCHIIFHFLKQTKASLQDQSKHLSAVSPNGGSIGPQYLILAMIRERVTLREAVKG